MNNKDIKTNQINSNIKGLNKKRDRNFNKFYIFIPISLNDNIAFEDIEDRIEDNKHWSRMRNDTRYFFKYISDKFNNINKDKNQCFTHILNKDCRKDLKFESNKHARIWKTFSKLDNNNYYFTITGISLHHFRTNICIIAYELSAIMLDTNGNIIDTRECPIDAKYLSTLQFHLKDVSRTKIVRLGENNIGTEDDEDTLLNITKEILADILIPSEGHQYFLHSGEGTARANMLSYMTVDSNDNIDINESLYYLKRMYSSSYAYLEDNKTDDEEYFSCVKHINWGVTSECAVCLVEVNDDNENFINNAFTKNFSDDYKFMYILLLHQKYMLYQFLTQIGVGVQNDLDTLEKYRADLCEFETNFMFVRITEVPQYQKLYDKISAQFRLKELYDDVDDPVSGLSELRKSKNDKALNAAMIGLSILSVYSALADGFSFFDNNFAPSSANILKILSSIFIAAIVIFVFSRISSSHFQKLLKKAKKKPTYDCENITEYTYSGWFVDSNELKEKLAPINREILDKEIEFTHVTLSYLPVNIYQEYFGTKAKISIIGYGKDSKNEGVIVEISTENEFLQNYSNKIGKNPHITLSISKDGRAVDTPKLKFTKLKNPIEIEGVYGAFTTKNTVIKE